MQIQKIKICFLSNSLNHVTVFFLFFVFLSFYFMIQNSEAASISTINGTVSDGLSITVSGTDFGSAPDVIVFDDFESGATGADIATGVGSAKYGEWARRDGSSYYGATASVSGTQSFTTDYSVHYSNWIQADLPANTRNVFISWWLYLPAGDNYPGEGGSGINWKQMWLQGSDTGDDDLVLPTRHSSWQINGNEGDPGYSNYTTVNFVKGEWKRLWVWLKGSTSSTSNDGEVKFWELLNTGVVQRENDTAANNLKASGVWERVRPNGFGNQASNCITSFDDIYIAAGPNAQARVEIGNASTYADSTRLTILTPTFWSDTSITATVNTGSFSTGDTAYLFVIDSNGTVSPGHPVVIGETQEGFTSPPPPSYDSGLLSFQEDNYLVQRTSEFAYLTISRVDGAVGEVSVQWSSNGDTAVHGVDYYGADNVTVNFADGETSKQIAIPLIQNDATVDRTFSVSLSNASDGASLGTTTSATVTITGVVVAPPPVLRLN
ncbi:Calx-beta domain-containing protein [uncultured Desulfuromusa sp.]|uniref:Calx-beta domain-containing protein n=1 Tax=uncultured Desulfuromusa sp. TaxID=219183 RepID=UPI002AA821CB|nr:Calx-beta domain-containing protein [uncultured Desulfuromusa sp.]